MDGLVGGGEGDEAEILWEEQYCDSKLSITIIIPDSTAWYTSNIHELKHYNFDNFLRIYFVVKHYHAKS